MYFDLPALQLYIIFIFLCILLQPHLGHKGLHILRQSVGRVITEFTLEPVLKCWPIHGRWQIGVNKSVELYVTT